MPASRVNSMLNKALKHIRSFHNMKQSELAKKLGISKSYISGIESGSCPVTLKVLEGYAKVFGIPISQLTLFSENLNDGPCLEKIRKVAARKILKILAWIDSDEIDEKDNVT